MIVVSDALVAKQFPNFVEWTILEQLMIERIYHVKVKSAFEPYGPSGRGLTRRVFLPPWMGCRWYAFRHLVDNTQGGARSRTT